MKNKTRLCPSKFFSSHEDIRSYCQKKYEENKNIWPNANEVLYSIYDNSTPKKCPVCGKYIMESRENRLTGKTKVCSQKCYRTPLGLKLARKRREETFIEKFGSIENGYKTAHLLAEKSCLEKYGSKNTGGLDWVKEKRTKTMIERYGAKTTLQSKELKEKVYDSMIKKYGVTTPILNKEICNKIKQTNLERYGNETTFKSKDILAKSIRTKNRNNERFLKDYKKQWEKDGFEFVDYLFPTSRHFFYVKCKVCGNIQKTYNDKEVICRKCHPHNTSSGHLQILKYINSLNYKTISNTRKIIQPQELDIFVKDKKLAIEFNGIYWHSKKDENYHLNKTENCEKQGIRLLHIYDIEWKTKQKIVKNMIKRILSPNIKNLDLSKCTIKKISKKLSKKFLLKYHIQGNLDYDIAYGMLYKNKLIALMTFKNSIFNNNPSWILVHFCTIDYFSPQNAENILLNAFRKNHKGTIVGYANRRLSNGNLYKTLGFSFIKNTPPDYCYTDGSKFFPKKKLEDENFLKKLKKYDSNVEVSENLLINGYCKIYNCGYKIYALR